MLVIKKCVYVCMCVCRPKHMWMRVYIIIMYMGIDRFEFV